MGRKPGEVALQTLRKTFDTNFFGLISLTQTLLPLIRKSDAGRIVNVSIGGCNPRALRLSPRGRLA